MRCVVVAFAIISSLLVSDPTGLLAKEPSNTSLTLLHTADIHGWTVPFDDNLGVATDHSLAHVATVVKAVRAEVESTILLDSGDTIQGTPFETITHVRFNQPSPTISAMNIIGYDAMTLGNHEFNYGLEILDRARDQAQFPFLAANTVSITSGEPAYKPYHIIERAGLRIGILGLVTPAIPSWEQPENFLGLRFVAPPEAARHWVPILRGKERCDLVVAVVHSGFECDIDSQESNGSETENHAYRLAFVEGIDLLLTGHSHALVEPRQIGNVIASQPGAHARFITRIDLELEYVEGRWRVADWSGENINTSGFTPDRGIVKRFSDAQRAVYAALESSITDTTLAVSVGDCRLKDCHATDLVHQVQLAASGAELSLTSLLSNATPLLRPGPVSWRWIRGLYVYPNTLLSVVVTGSQVKDILEHSARFYDGLECIPSGPCTVLTDPTIQHYNVDNMAGVSYRIDPGRTEGDRIRDLMFEGRPIDLQRRFTLVCNNYRRVGGGRYPHLTEAEVVWRSSTEMNDLIATFLENHQPWTPIIDNNWLIAPEMIAEKPLSELQ